MTPLRRSVVSYFAAAVVLALVVGFAIFDFGYYLHLARGQLRLVFSCVPISELLADPGLAPGRRARFDLVRAVREYGRGQIGLAVGDQYTSFYDTGNRPVSWNVSASPPDRFEPYRWCFPIVGAVPYKGFFDPERATREREHLEERGYDVWAGPVSAFSTLGFFADPILSNMIAYPEDALATLLLHELTHSTVFAPNQTEFNESLATFVGKTGALGFLAERYGALSPQVEEAHRRRADAEAFRGFVHELVSRLDSLYNSDLPRERILAERVSVFERAKEEYRSVRAQLLRSPSRFDGFLEWDMNNARLLSYRRYHDLDDFDDLYRACDRSMPHFLEICSSCAAAQQPRDCLRDSTAAMAQSESDVSP